MAKLQVDQRGGQRKKYVPWDIVEDLLSAAGEMTMADLFRGYKDAVRAAYAQQWVEYRNVQPGVRRKKAPKKPPKGATYHSFVVYMNVWTNDGRIEKVLNPDGTVKRGLPQYAHQLSQLEPPAYYKLT